MNNETVLVIDDDKATRVSLQMFLEFEGFAVSSCESGAAALDLINRKHFGILMIGHRMREMKGDDLTRQLRSLCPDAFILGFSVESNNDEVFIRAGANAFLSKQELVRKLIPLIKNRTQM